MNCKIVGYEFKYLEVELQPGEEFYGERGAFVCADEGIEKDSEWLGRGLGGIFMGAFSGESILQVHYRNTSGRVRKLALAGSYANLLPFKITGGDTLLVRKGGYVASSTRMNIELNFSLRRLVSGMSLTMQCISGNGTVFVDCIGMPITRTLEAGETIEVDEDHVVALQNISDGQISSGWNISNIFMGEGLSTMKITGPGTVCLSPIPFTMPQLMAAQQNNQNR